MSSANIVLLYFQCRYHSLLLPNSLTRTFSKMFEKNLKKFEKSVTLSSYHKGKAFNLQTMMLMELFINVLHHVEVSSYSELSEWFYHGKGFEFIK